MARDAGASLFVSVHADTLARSASVAGATVYTVSDKASDAEAARLAESENLADSAAGVDSADDQNDVNDILFDLTRRETRINSHAFASTLVGYLKEVSRMNKNPRRSAGFRVLKAPDVPSVLLELGYLSSQSDAGNLLSVEWRERAGAKVALAIDEFFRTRTVALQNQAPSALPMENSKSESAVAPVGEPARELNGESLGLRRSVNAESQAAPVVQQQH